MTEDSKTDSLLAKAKSISNGGSASGIIDLRRGIKCATATRVRERSGREYMSETALQTPRSVEKEGEEVLQARELRLPCSPW